MRLAPVVLIGIGSAAVTGLFFPLAVKSHAFSLGARLSKDF